MLRGDSLSMGLSEAPAAALVEHGANIMMIEQGAQQPEAWAQDIPVAMRTPSLEARQVGIPSPAAYRLEVKVHSEGMSR